MAKETKVIHVHLIFKKTSRFFGSISAIYSEFTAEEIGITEETLRHKGLSDGVSFATKKSDHTTRNTYSKRAKITF